VIGITPLDERSRPVTYERSAAVQVTRLPGDPRWATISVKAGAAVADPSLVAGRLAAFTREQAEQMYAVYAEIGGRASVRTDLKSATRTSPSLDSP
jgi:hypothetical protein